MEEWINMWYIYPMEYYSAFRKNKIMPLELSVMLSEVKDKYQDKYMMLLKCGT